MRCRRRCRRRRRGRRRRTFQLDFQLFDFSHWIYKNGFFIFFNLGLFKN